ncbi:MULTISPECIES: EAL domain-containing protein [unclassified Neptuniibacter]|uniref:EAL domain-containing protein n=1 Tax=unclassified Neptuniibacter TaxID=2630693 RepID=UPI000C3AD663|nr:MULTISPECIES: EAL domain-containing protein [unclassified Neptuniibacter]MAY41622.1 hypothetical protein [Oceanospirillaceae bacterium]|tara:strand:- start:806 stop:3166 length:2361 start_codon:yes stop_codon:yes gene_type:complete
MLNSKNSLKLKLLIVLIPGAIIALSLTVLIMLYQAEQQFTHKLDEKRNILGNYTVLFADPLWNYKTEQVEGIVTTMLLDQDISQIKIHDEGGNLVAEESASNHDPESASEFSFPIIYTNAHISQKIGSMTFYLGNQSLQGDKKQFILSGLFSFFLIIICLSLGVWLILSRLMDKPLRALIHAIKSSQDSDSYIRVNHQSNDEFGVISDAFNEMQNSLELHHKNTLKAKEHLQLLYHSTPSLLLSFNHKGIIQDASDYFLQQLGYKREDIIGSDLEQLLQMEKRSAVIDNLLATLWSDQQLTEYPLQLVKAQGEIIDVLMDATLSARDSFPGALAVVTDVTSLNKARAELEHQANTDHLSGISNRYSFQAYLQKLTLDRRESNKPFALLFIDLDHFKLVNDTYGHHTGDQLLRLVSERIQTVLRPDDKIARLGGDEFAVILENLESESTAEQIAQRIIQHLETSFSLCDANIYISASIGLSLYPEDGNNPAELIQYADLAMYRAKDEGRSCIASYSHEHSRLVEERLRIDGLLRRAITDNLLEVHYQPIISLMDKKIIGIEALLRLKDDAGNLISPVEFIPIAEETGLIVAIGEWCIQESCQRLACWQKQMGNELYLSINISPRQFQAKTFYPALETSIVSNGLIPANIMVEITESLLLHNNQNNQNIFAKLNTLGCQIAIDDFGTGYSALSYLMKFPLNVLKIDRSFISEYGEGNLSSGLVAAIIQMSHSMNLKVIAEGVETHEQLKMLQILSKEIGIQGYYFARPMAALELTNSFEKLNQKASML